MSHIHSDAWMPLSVHPLALYSEGETWETRVEMRKKLEGWSVDFGKGATPVAVPHAWRQEMPVWWDGPAVYRTKFETPEAGAWLVFHGVSYEAVVFVNGQKVATHRGIWDAFSVQIPESAGKTIDLVVEVTKNGGSKFPVRDVASGFLPYVFHTFGGIYQDVEWVSGPEDPLAHTPTPSPSRIRAEGSRLWLDDKPFYMRGVLTWGWYPELGHTNPPEETIRKEARVAKSLGFNTIKFCLWVPTHRHLEILEEQGLEAWVELPMWDPSPEAGHLGAIAAEIERIVRQYRHHRNILVWTIGCELSHNTPADYRQMLVDRVKEITGSPMVKDNSGGAEMYGGDLREYGDFYDFHPYCDLQFYPPVLDSLMPVSRSRKPILLGEFNDIDVHRDVASLHAKQPFWGSPDANLNDVGVRWQHDLPNILANARYCQPEFKRRHLKLMESSRQKALFIRKTVHEAVREREPISGYVITGWRDTPIATAGMVDDWGNPRFSKQEMEAWNGPDCLFIIPTRRPPWVDGGNRPGWLDPFVFRPGQVFWRLGASLSADINTKLSWKITAENGDIVAQGAGPELSYTAFVPQEAAEVAWQNAEPGLYTLAAWTEKASNCWDIEVVPKSQWDQVGGWTVIDPANRLEGLNLPEGNNLLATEWGHGFADTLGNGHNALLLAEGCCTKPAPFWRESGFEFRESKFWDAIGIAERWERFWGIAGDRVLDLDELSRNLPMGTIIEPLMLRVDVRTYQEAPVLARCRLKKATMLATTLRPDGGLGMEPKGLARNPSGSNLLWKLLGYLAK